nr:hypothetical protein [Angustibacter aerolatus]
MPGVRVQPASSLAALVGWYRGEPPPEPLDDAPPAAATAPAGHPLDLADVVGQARGQVGPGDGRCGRPPRAAARAAGLRQDAAGQPAAGAAAAACRSPRRCR